MAIYQAGIISNILKIVQMTDYKNAFFERGGRLPNQYISKGIVVKQINHVTNEVIKEFPSIRKNNQKSY